jgi:FtsH-binding integral membrane protein
MESRERERPSQVLVTVAGITSVLYFTLTVRFAWRIAASGVNASSKRGLAGVVFVTLVLYAIAAAVAFSERRRASALVPIVGASLFGIFICLFLYWV